MAGLRATLAAGLLLLAWGSGAHAGPPRVSELALTRGQDGWRAAVRWSVPWESDPYRAVRKGVPMEFTVKLRLFARRPWWPDAVVRTTRFSREVHYNHLTRQYRVIDWRTDRRHFTRQWDRARDMVQRTGPVPLVRASRLEEGRRYYVGVQVAASSDHLSLPARIVATFTGFWGTRSEWRYRPLER